MHPNLNSSENLIKYKLENISREQCLAIFRLTAIRIIMGLSKDETEQETMLSIIQ